MMNLVTILQDLNPGKFVVYTSLLVFVPLLSLRFDGTIQICYWIIFTPIWMWKLIVFVGGAVGSYSRWRKTVVDPESAIHFKSMMLSLGVHILLLVFEILACDNLQSGQHMWVLVFLPLFCLSVSCIGLSIWALKSTRPFELELLGGVNLLQFIFVALRLDGLISWQWQMVFIPLWSLFGVAMIAVSYSILLAIVFLRSTAISSEQRRSSLQTALGYTSLIVPAFVSLVLLTRKLDDDIELPYAVICIPLVIALISLIMRSFSARGGNLWWCGMQKDFYPFLLDMLPSLREYGNVSYQLDTSSAPQSAPSRTDHLDHFKRIKRNLRNDSRAVVPMLTIDAPD